MKSEKDNRSFFWANRRGLSFDSMELFYHSMGASDMSNPLYLNMILSGSVIGIKGNASGEGLQCVNERLDGASLNDFGDVYPTEASRIKNLSPLLGGKLHEVFVLCDESFGDEIGMLFGFSTGFLFILNLGDEIFVLRDLPASVGPTVKRRLL